MKISHCEKNTLCTVKAQVLIYYTRSKTCCLNNTSDYLHLFLRSGYHVEALNSEQGSMAAGASFSTYKISVVLVHHVY